MGRLLLLVIFSVAVATVFPALAQDDEVMTEEPSDEVVQESPLPGIEPTPLPTPRPEPTVQAVPVPGDVLLSDNFEDLTRPNFPLTSRDPNRQSQGYVDGEYEIINGRPGGTGVGESVRGTYADSSIAIDARLSGGPENAGVYVSCRRVGGEDEGYQLTVRPAVQQFRLHRYQGVGQGSTLVEQSHPGIRGKDQVNRLELSCAGNRLTASINGAQVASVLDSTYTRGATGFGVVWGGTRVRFDNLVITQR